MNFMQWLNSLDELLYEVVSWLLFFPLTLGKVLRHPLVMMEYAETQLSLPEDRQFKSDLTPPIFLALALLLSHAVEIGATGINPVIANHRGLDNFINDDTSLLLLRIFVFSIFPLLLGAWMVWWRDGGALDRDLLKGPFYAQCYVAAPVALLVSLGTLAHGQSFHVWQMVGGIVLVVALLFYVGVESVWFARKLNRSLLRGFLHAFTAILLIMMLALAILLPFALQR